jgi:ABC-type Fe3+ transport system substrate-binding protein
MSAQPRLLNRVAVLVAALLASVVAACGSSDEPSTTSSTTTANTPAEEQTVAFKKVLAAAEKEGELNLNWGLTAPDVQPLIDAFNERHPQIKVTVTPNKDQPGNTAKMIEEVKAGKAASSDAYLGVPQLLVSAGPHGADVMEKVDWTSIAPWTKGLATSDQVGLTLMDQIAGFTYNTTEFEESELPKSASDVLELEQPIASTPYAANFNELGAPEAMGVEGLQQYIKAFDPAGFIGCGDLSRIASGEFAALWIACGANIGEIFAAQGAPIDTVVLKDAALTGPWYMGIPKSSAHPNAAKVWITWLVTPEAQRILYGGEYADNRRIEGSETAKQIADYEAEGIEFTFADYEFVADHPEIYDRKFAGQLIGLLTQK